MGKWRELDEHLFIYLNSFHSPFLDQAMYLMAQTYLWLPIHFFLAYLIIKHYKKDSWVLILCLAITITASDQLTSGLMKPFFERLRPSHEPNLADTIHLVNNYKGGLYGFASSHAANTFALATFIWFVFRQQYKHILWIFLWAFIVTYTRIYLGVHYPGDVIAGGFIGFLCGLGGYQLQRFILSAIQKRQLRDIT
jgi:undecaprenyl-diphosphatase